MPTFNALDATYDLKDSIEGIYDSFFNLDADIATLRNLSRNDHRYGNPIKSNDNDELNQLRNQLDDLLFEFEDKIEPKLSELTFCLEKAAYLATTEFAAQPKTNPTKTNIAKVQKILKLNSPEKAEAIIEIYNKYYA